MRLRIELSNSPTTVEHFMQYDIFRVGLESDLFRLNIGPSTSGTLNDTFSLHNNLPFSTADSDNSPGSFKCSREWQLSGWWFNSCYTVCLTCSCQDVGEWLPVGSNGHSGALKFNFIKMLITPIVNNNVVYSG